MPEKARKKTSSARKRFSRETVGEAREAPKGCQRSLSDPRNLSFTGGVKEVPMEELLSGTATRKRAKVLDNDA